MNQDFLKEAIMTLQAAEAAFDSAENSESSRYRESCYRLGEDHLRNAQLLALLSICVDLRRIAEVLSGASKYIAESDEDLKER